VLLPADANLLFKLKVTFLKCLRLGLEVLIFLFAFESAQARRLSVFDETVLGLRQEPPHADELLFRDRLYVDLEFAHVEPFFVLLLHVDDRNNVGVRGVV
jgi:hypothetical protein